MHLSNEQFTEVEIISFNSRCKLDGMSYEQTVNVRTGEGSVFRLFDFMGFAVNESRLGKNKKIVLCVRYIEGEVAVLESGDPQLLDNDFEWESEDPSRLMLIGKVLENNSEDYGLLVDVGFGKIFVIPDEDVSAFSECDIIKFKAQRLDLLEILE